MTGALPEPIQLVMLTIGIPHLVLRNLGVLLTLAWLAYAAVLVFDLDGGKGALTLDLAYNGLLFAAAALCAARVIAFRSEFAPWALLAIGLAMWSSGDIYYTAVEPPTPSLADVGWLAIYPCGCIALILCGPPRDAVRRGRGRGVPVHSRSSARRVAA